MLKTPCSVKVMPLVKTEAVNSGLPEKHQYDHCNFFLENSNYDLMANQSNVDLLTDDEEHLLPIRQNPIFRSDIEKRHANRSLHRSEKSVTVGSDVASSANDASNASPRQTGTEHSCQASQKTIKSMQKVLRTQNNQFSDDDCEVAYGQGFVLKLLKRFHSLSVRQNGSQLQSSASSNSLLDNVVLAGQSRCYGTANLISSWSVDNIVNLAANDGSHHASSIWTRSVLHQPTVESNSCMPESDFSDQPVSSDSCCSDRDELPKPNIVKTVRTMFETISQNHIHNCTFLHAPKSGKCSKSGSQHMVMTSDRNSSSVMTSQVCEKTSASDIDDCNQPSVSIYSGEKKFSWHSKPNHLSKSQSTLDTQTHTCSPPVLMTTALDDKKVALKELPARKGLHLDFAELPAVKKFEKARLLPPALLSDPLMHEGQIDPGFTTYHSDNHIPVTDVDDLVDSGFSDSWDHSVGSVLKEGDPSVITDSNTGLNYEFEGAGIVVDRSLLRKSRNNKQVILSGTKKFASTIDI